MGRCQCPTENLCRAAGVCRREALSRVKNKEGRDNAVVNLRARIMTAKEADPRRNNVIPFPARKET